MKKNCRKPSPQRGFTLLEVMVVLIIIVTIAGLAVGAFWGRLIIAQKRAAYTYIETLAAAVEAYKLDVGRVPTTEQGLAALVALPGDLPNPAKWGGPYLKDTATSQDPWGNDYQYSSPGKDNREFSIWSYGPDGVEGTEDDIGSWMPSNDFR